MESSTDRMVVVSTDSHAGVPHELWTEYLPKEYHDLLPKLRQDNKIYPTATWLLIESLMTQAEYAENHKRTGYRGLYDPDVRLAEMDREGVAAELIFLGDFRLGDMFHNIHNDQYPLDAWAAGARGWNRFIFDTFVCASDRFLPVGATGPCVDMDETLADLDWIADHRFVGAFAPGYPSHPQMPPLHDRYWDPYLARSVERGLPLVVHAGYGAQQGVSFAMFREAYDAVVEASGSDDLDVMIAYHEASKQSAITTKEFFADVKPRRPLWQLMLGGAFDRYPELRVVLTEIRGDWIPAILRHLDEVFDRNRADVPAKKKPSEYWAEHFLVGVSFTHECEVAMRHEIGIHQFTFGRDYPHPESTWPHTREWLRAAFAGVPEDELRLILGENAARFFDLDLARLAETAARIGPTWAEINSGAPVSPDLIDHFEARGGFLKPAEGATRLDKVDEVLADDLLTLAHA